MLTPDPIKGIPSIHVFKSCQHKIEWIDGKPHGDLGWEMEQYRFRTLHKADEEILREHIVTVNDHLISDLRYIVMALEMGSKVEVKSALEGMW
jgi:hypothetical protein